MATSTSYRPGTTTTQAFTGTSAQTSGTFGRGTYRLWADQDCYVAFGPNPTAAAASSMPLTAKTPEYVDLQAGDKIAVIQLSAGGTLSITPVGNWD
jgi:hypothetical protein